MTHKVMLADDEEGILALVAATLGDDGNYQLILARDGDEALRVARQEQPALLFLDVLMPARNGYEVCRLLKSDPATASMKIVMLTALAQDSAKQKALEAGADDYLTKPFSPTTLLEKVEAFRRMDQENTETNQITRV